MTQIPPSAEVTDHASVVAEVDATEPLYRAAIFAAAHMARAGDPNLVGYIEVVTLGMSHDELTAFLATAIGCVAGLLELREA